MTDIQFTPGPWHICEQPGRFLIVKKDAPADIHIATVKGDSDTQEADAALIAAAPDLLEALDAVIAQAEPIIESLDVDGYYQSAYKQQFDVARAAIDKARARQTVS